MTDRPIYAAASAGASVKNDSKVEEQAPSLTSLKQTPDAIRRQLVATITSASNLFDDQWKIDFVYHDPAIEFTATPTDQKEHATISISNLWASLSLFTAINITNVTLDVAERKVCITAVHKEKSLTGRKRKAEEVHPAKTKDRHVLQKALVESAGDLLGSKTPKDVTVAERIHPENGTPIVSVTGYRSLGIRSLLELTGQFSEAYALKAAAQCKWNLTDKEVVFSQVE